MPHLRVVLGRLPDLREGYRQCARGSRTAADRAIASVCVALRKDRVSGLLDQILGTYGRNASTWTTVPPRSFVREEAELSREFGFRPAEARKHIKAMYGSGRPEHPLCSLDELIEAISRIHIGLVADLGGARSFRERAAAIREADRFVFAIGALVVDGGRSELLVHSYSLASAKLHGEATHA